MLISDLHLAEDQQEIVDLFFHFLHKIARPQAESLYILGDFFETWIGDDDLTLLHVSVIQALRQATDHGLTIYVMHGNRDFLLGKKFFHATGCIYLPDVWVCPFYGVPTLLMHGDTLCTRDVAYLKFRRRSRNWLLQKLFLLKPLEKRRALATQYRQASKMHVSTLAADSMDVTQEEVECVMRRYEVQHLIHGHTHRQAVHSFALGDGVMAQRTVLGDWGSMGNALVCDASGKQEFLSF